MKLYNYISKTFFVMAFAMLCSFIATLKLGEVLSTESFGVFNLLKRIFPMCAAIILLGIDKSYIKYFSSNSAQRVLKYIAPLVAFNAIIITYIITYLYNFQSYQLSILICLIIFSLTLFLSSHARLKDKYGTAQFIQAGHKIIFFILVITLISFYNINSFGIINIFMISFLIPFFYIIKYCKDERAIESSISFNNFKNLCIYGFLFFSVNILNLLIVNMEGLLIPYFYGQEANGIYSGLSFIYITVFTMIGTSIGYVLFPMLSKKEKINIKKLRFYAALGIIGLFTLFTIFGDSINSIAFKGKFDIYRSFKVDLMIILIGIFQFINGLLHWFILGLGSIKNITDYLKIIVGVLIIYFFSTIYITSYNLEDFFAIIPIVLTAWIFKVLLTIIYIKRTKLFDNYSTNKNAV